MDGINTITEMQTPSDLGNTAKRQDCREKGRRGQLCSCAAQAPLRVPGRLLNLQGAAVLVHTKALQGPL